MLQEVIDLQNKAVSKLVSLSKTSQSLITFKAPTGSGKTRMMGDFMNRVLAEHNDVIFLVSTLSKGGLAEQNYNAFVDCVEKGIFSNLVPYLISSEVGNEEGVYIPTDCNVYVLPRDLYKSTGRLAEGGFINFLETMTSGTLQEQGKGKKIYVIKDECHQATNNLDALGVFFSKVFNFSATPNLGRGQTPHVEITEEEAVEARLIKHIEEGDDKESIDIAISKFEQIKVDYRNLLNVNPCLIIQISNGLDAEKEWNDTILPALNKHQALKWMMIVDKNDKCQTNDDIQKTLPVSRWKDYAKDTLSTIDVIIFKMVISEGWDIPRACMLYQIRDTESKILDEQVMGRVRRNPRLVDFETLSPKAQELATTAWIWGVKDGNKNKSYAVKLRHDGKTIQSNVKIRTTRLKPLTEKVNFSVSSFLSAQKSDLSSPSIFDLYKKLIRQDGEVSEMCYAYATDIDKWFDFTKHVDAIAVEHNNYKCDYSQSMEITKDEHGKIVEVSFPNVSYVKDNGVGREMANWVWCRKDGEEFIPFDSDAECKWAWILYNIAQRKIKVVTLTKDDHPEFFESENEEAYLWGKNFLVNSEIKFEYYSNGLHFSYPDFIMVDRNGNTHIMEVKSLNGNGTVNFDIESYQDKIKALQNCYQACSKLLPNYYFYIPVLEGTDWTIYRYKDGIADTLTRQQFEQSL